MNILYFKHIERGLLQFSKNYFESASYQYRNYSAISYSSLESLSHECRYSRQSKQPCTFLKNDKINCSQYRNSFQSSMAHYTSSDFAPVGFAQSFLLNAHEFTGLPWWANIALITISLRTLVTLPVSIYSQYVLARVELLQPDIQKTAYILKADVSKAINELGWDQKWARVQYNRNMKRLVRDLYIRDNCHPLKASLIIWIQIPMWICMSMGLRNIAGALPFKGESNVVLSPDLATEGILWFPNLLLPDITWVLPVMMAVCNLSIIEMHALHRLEKTTYQKVILNVMRGLCIVLVPIAAQVPSCMSMYWTISSLYGLSQNIFIKFPTVRRMVLIPITDSESTTPFKDIIANAKLKYRFKKTK